MASEKASCNAQSSLVPARRKRKKQKKQEALCNNNDRSHDSSESGLTEAQSDPKLNCQQNKKKRKRLKRRRLNGPKTDQKDVHPTEVTSETMPAPSGTKASLHVSIGTVSETASPGGEVMHDTNTEMDLVSAPVREEALVSTNTEMDSVTEMDSSSVPVKNEASVGMNIKTDPVMKLSRRKRKKNKKKKQNENFNNSMTANILPGKDSFNTFAENVSLKKQNDGQNATQTNSVAHFQMANGKHLGNKDVKFPLEGQDLTKIEGDLLLTRKQSGSSKFSNSSLMEKHDVNSDNNTLFHETRVVVPYHRRNGRKSSHPLQVENAASTQVLEDIVMREASGNGLEDQTACKDGEKITKMKKSQENISRHIPTKNMSVQLERHIEQENKDKVGEIQVKVQDASCSDDLSNEGSFDPKDKTSHNVFGHGTFCKHLEHKNVEVETKMENIFPAPHLGLVKDDVAEGGTGKEIDFPLMLHSSLERVCIGHSRKKLLVLDVNGILADIVAYPHQGYKADIIVSKKAVFKRPYCDDFLRFCFERFNIGVWSSRIKKNVERVIEFLMGDLRDGLLFCWDASHCSNTGHNTVENKNKPLVLKELKKLWEKLEPDLPWEKGEYNETNTLLLDDSPYKALLNPVHTAIFPYSYAYTDDNDVSLGPGGDLRVYLEGLAVAENVQEYVQQHPFGQRAITESNPSWRFYSKIISIESGQPHDNGNTSIS